MQQTTTYNLKHINADDPFGPDTLNDNTDAVAAQLARIDAALSAEQSARESADAAEKTRVDAALAAKAAQTDLTWMETALSTEQSARKTDVARIDAALLHLATGTYTGDNTKNRKIEVGFTPKMVYVGVGDQGLIISASGERSGGMALESLPVEYSATGEIIVEIVEGGFLVSHVGYYTANRDNYTFRWFAIG